MKNLLKSLGLSITNSRTMLYSSVTDTTLPFTDEMFDAHIVEHTYKYGRGRIVFDQPVTECGFWRDDKSWDNWELRRSIRSLVLPSELKVLRERALSDCHRLETIRLPKHLCEIGESAFSGCKKLISVWMSDSVVSIGDEAFCKCCELSQVRMSRQVTHIGNRAFYCCGFSRITLPERLKSIGYLAFAGSKLTELTLPESLKSIEECAFAQCRHLTSYITIPNSVECIGDRVFEGCDKVAGFYGKHTSSDHRAIIVDGALKAFSSAGHPTIYAVTIPKGVTSIGESVFAKCFGLQEVTIPDGVKTIGRNAFDGCSQLSRVTIPDSVTSIEACAFAGCHSLSSVKIPNRVTIIGAYAFVSCWRLRSVVIPASVTTIGAFAFAGCERLQSLVIPDSVTLIERGAVGDCQLVVVGKHVKSMRDAFLTTRVSWQRIIVFTAPIGEGLGFEIPATKVYFPIDAMPSNTHCFRSCHHTSEVEVIGYHPSELESIVASELALIQSV